MRGKLTIIFFVILTLVFPALTFSITPEETLDIKPYYATDKVNAGSTFQIAIEMNIKKGWHINSNKPSNEFAIPTEVKFKLPRGIRITEITFPEHEIMTLKSVGRVEIFSGKFYIIITGHAAETLMPGEYKLPATLTYQACNDAVCLPPTSKTITFNLNLVPAGSPVKRLNNNIFSKGAQQQETTEKSSSAFSVTGGGDISALVAQKGMFLTLILIFLGGLALNLTPCVYPLIPITISYFGGLKHKGRGFINALFYVLGIAVMYSALGTIAALSGSMLGTQLTSPAVSIAIASIMVVLALSMFGLYEIRVPSSLMRLAGGEAKSGVAGSFVMGVTMGIVAAPCIGPFVLGLLTYVAAKGDPFTGFIMFFFLALGLGLPYLILGTFSSKISALPRSGEWMIGVRKIFGFILIIMAVYFLDPVLNKATYDFVFSLSLFVSGAWLIIFDRSGINARGFHIIKSIIAIAMIIVASWVFFSTRAPKKVEIQWKQYTEELMASARNSSKPVVIDFFADWCIPCKELDTITFSDPSVVNYDGRVIFVKVDLTNDKSSFVQKIKKKYNIKGVPTVVFLGKDGKEIKRLRLIGFVGPEDFIKRLDAALAE